MSVGQLIRSSALLLASVTLFAGRARGQSTTSLQTDATVMPRHQLGIRLLTGFARFDELIGDGGTRNIAASFATDSFGPTHLQGLANSQTLIRSLSGLSALNVTAGPLVSSADSRVVTAPLILEYGLTSKLTLGVVIPLVETRTVFYSQLNPKAGFANVGQNPALLSNNWTSNQTIITSLRSAAASLQARLAQCQTTPTGTGCSTILAQQSTVQSLITSTGTFATGLAALYGTSASQPGAFFVPIGGTAAQTAIETAIQNFRTQYTSFGGTVAAGSVAGAAGPAARVAFQQLLAQAGYDSLQSSDRSSIGDITIGATYQLANTFGDSTQERAHRFAVNAGWRIGTGEPANRNRILDNPTGYGQPGVIVGGAADFKFTGRYYLSAIGSYTKQLGSVDVSRPANAGNALLPLVEAVPASYSAGDNLSINLVPRVRVSGLFTVDGYYTVDHVAAESYAFAGLTPADPLVSLPVGPSYGASSATIQRIGLGFSYTSSLNDRAPGRLPYEASFRHIETLSATGGPVAKISQDQIQLRVFLR